MQSLLQDTWKNIVMIIITGDCNKLPTRKKGSTADPWMHMGKDWDFWIKGQKIPQDNNARKILKFMDLIYKRERPAILRRSKRCNVIMCISFINTKQYKIYDFFLIWKIIHTLHKLKKIPCCRLLEFNIKK